MREEDDLKIELRSADEVAKRCIILCCVTAHAEDATLLFEDWLVAENLWSRVSPSEAIFLRDISPPERNTRNLLWRQESLLALLWSLGRVDPIPPPVQMNSGSIVIEHIPHPGASTSDFVTSSSLRPFEVIDEAYEANYELHWKLRDAQINQRPLPPNVDRGVVYERHYAWNWLRRYGVSEEQGWDDITTDT